MSSRNAPTQFLDVQGGERYAYRRFGSLFQYHDSFARHAAAFLSADTESAVY